MNDPPHAGLPGRREERKRVADGVGVPEKAMIESHPIRVVQNGYALKVFGQQVRPVERQRERPDAVAKRIGPTGGVGEGYYRVPGIEKPLGDVFAGISIGPGNRMSLLHGHVVFSFQTGVDVSPL